MFYNYPDIKEQYRRKHTSFFSNIEIIAKFVKNLFWTFSEIVMKSVFDFLNAFYHIVNSLMGIIKIELLFCGLCVGPGEVNICAQWRNICSICKYSTTIR
jgi:hypothetical protein